MSTRIRTRAGTFAAGLLAAAVALATPATAATIYDEAIDGDLTGFAPFPVLALSTGPNTVLGSVTFSFQGAVAADFDGFGFSVPAGNRLVAVNITSALRPEGEGVFDSFGLAFNGSDFQAVGIPSLGEALFAGSLPFGPGIGEIVFTNLNGSLLEGQYRTADYTITLTLREVAEVPAPGALLPMLVGLAGLGLTRRRKA